jgi:hypothetical protein
MIPAEIRSAVRTLQAQGHGLHEISRLLALSRNTVRCGSRRKAARYSDLMAATAPS